MTITNLFILLNLGSEMLYVIDQRLKAQAIPLDKSAQGKLRDLQEKNPSISHNLHLILHRGVEGDL